MAAISIGGQVTCKAGTDPVSLKTFDNGNQVANFSVCDLEYVYAKEGEERFGQFYAVQVNGKAAEIAAERLQRGDKLTVHGQLVQRTYNDKVYLDVKNARITYQEKRREEVPDEDAPF